MGLNRGTPSHPDMVNTSFASHVPRFGRLTGRFNPPSYALAIRTKPKDVEEASDVNNEAEKKEEGKDVVGLRGKTDTTTEDAGNSQANNEKEAEKEKEKEDLTEVEAQRRAVTAMLGENRQNRKKLIAEIKPSVESSSTTQKSPPSPSKIDPRRGDAVFRHRLGTMPLNELSKPGGGFLLTDLPDIAVDYLSKPRHRN